MFIVINNQGGNEEEGCALKWQLGKYEREEWINNTLPSCSRHFWCVLEQGTSQPVTLVELVNNQQKEIYFVSWWLLQNAFRPSFRAEVNKICIMASLSHLHRCIDFRGALIGLFFIASLLLSQEFGCILIKPQNGTLKIWHCYYLEIPVFDEGKNCELCNSTKLRRMCLMYVSECVTGLTVADLVMPW